MHRVHRLVACAGAAGALSLCPLPTLLADDLNPPPWPRFTPGTTFQAWDFHTGPAGGPPDEPLPGNFFNPSGVPILTPPNPGNWLPSFAGHSDVWAVNTGNPLLFTIPNYNVPTEQKVLQLQVTFFGQPPPPSFNVVAQPSGQFVLLPGTIIIPFADGWTHITTFWGFPECPHSEQVTINPPVPGTTAFIDQVVIDTICVVPSPAGAALLALGIPGLARRRRR